MKWIVQGEAEEILHDQPEENLWSFITNHLIRFGCPVIQKEHGEFSLQLINGSLSLRFSRHEEGGVEGICAVEWLEKAAGGMGIPRWEFRWRNGMIDEQDAARFDELMQWVEMVNVRPICQVPVYSRCQDERICVPLLNGEERSVSVREILYLQAERDWTRLTFGHGSQQESVLLDYSIGKCERELTAFGFMRIHRSYVVNPGCIHRCMDSGMKNQVELCDGSRLPVARRRCAELRARLSEIRAMTNHSSENGRMPNNT